MSHRCFPLNVLFQFANFVRTIHAAQTCGMLLYQLIYGSPSGSRRCARPRAFKIVYAPVFNDKTVRHVFVCWDYGQVSQSIGITALHDNRTPSCCLC